MKKPRKFRSEVYASRRALLRAWDRWGKLVAARKAAR